MNLACPHCRHEQDVAEPKPGQGVQCPACFKVFVPFPNPAPPAVPPTPQGPIPPPCFVPVNADLEHLRLLRMFHFIAGGILGFFSCFALIYIVLGIFFINSPHLFDSRGNGPPPFMGWMFVMIGAMALLMGWTIATLMFLGGKYLGRRTHYTFCFVVAAVSCLFSPIGTVLGVFTIVVLSRQSVKQLFNGKQNSIERGA